MALTQKLQAMIESAKNEKLAQDAAVKREDAEKQEIALQLMRKMLIHGIGDELWSELEASGATIKTDRANFTANLLLEVHDTALQVVVSPHNGADPQVKALVHLYQTGSCVLNGKAHYFGAEEAGKGCLREPVLLAFSHIQA